MVKEAFDKLLNEEFLHLSAFSQSNVPPMMSILPGEHHIDEGDPWILWQPWWSNFEVNQEDSDSQYIVHSFIIIREVLILTLSIFIAL